MFVSNELPLMEFATNVIVARCTFPDPSEVYLLFTVPLILPCLLMSIAYRR